MARTWPILGFLLLATCDDNRHHTWSSFSRRVTVDVVNNGTATAYGRAENWNGGDEETFSLAPGQTTTFKLYIDYRLKVHIWRLSDNLVLVDDFWDLDDLDKLDDRVLLTVTP
jgi:hypothetical protein